jgi:hypothetical protein
VHTPESTDYLIQLNEKKNWFTVERTTHVAFSVVPRDIELHFIFIFFPELLLF